jgi:hypothetical protein
MFVGVTAFEGFIYTPGVGPTSSMYAVQRDDGKVTAVKYPRSNGGFQCYGTTPPSIAGGKAYWVDAPGGKVLVTSLAPNLTEIGRAAMVEDAKDDMNGLIEKGKPTLDEYLNRYGRDKDNFPAKFALNGGPFFQGNRMYLRTSEYLYCIGAPEAGAK